MPIEPNRTPKRQPPARTTNGVRISRVPKTTLHLGITFAAPQTIFSGKLLGWTLAFAAVCEAEEEGLLSNWSGKFVERSHLGVGEGREVLGDLYVLF